MAYLIAFLALAAIPLAMAAYGGHLAAIALEGKPRRRALIIVWGLAAFGIILFGVQQYMVYRADRARDAKEVMRDADQARQRAQLSAIDNGVSELKRLTEAKPGDPPEKVLAAAAAKILELDEKTKQLEAGVRDLTSTRRLDSKQKKILIETLRSSNYKGKVGLLWVRDSEALAYANDFYSVLAETGALGYRSELPEQFNPGSVPRGVLLLAKRGQKPTKEAIELNEVFNKAGIPHTPTFSSDVGDVVTIVVGFRR